MRVPVIPKVTLKLPRTWTMGILTVGIIGSTATVYLTSRHPAAPTDINHLTVAVKQENLTLEIQASGSVRPIESVNISPKTSGRLTELLVEKGDRVKEGQVIARMEDTEIRAQLIEAQANLSRQEASLSELLAGSRPEDIAQGRARLSQTEARLAQLLAGSRLEDIAQAQAQLEAVQAKERLAIARLERNRQLLADGAIAQDQLDEATADAESAAANSQEAINQLAKLKNGSRPQEIAQARAEVAEARSALTKLENGSRPQEIAQARAEVAVAKAQVLRVQSQMQDSVVVAPFSGLITQRYASIGAFVTPTTSASSSASATSTSIVALATGLEILAELSEVDISKIKVGQMVQIRTDAYPQKVFQGRVRLIAPEAVRTNNVTSFQVQIAIETGQEKLLSGMNVRLTLLGSSIPQALVVPNVAVLTQNGKTGVLVPNEENKPKFRPVTLGPVIGDKTQVLNGVKVGERVFIDYPEDSP
ncbi:MAG: efflux RND transporter periplasmic adaptor subunit [Microcystis aeruginosa L111-01]|jgi:HlyD family secretion protein|nr:efflux RND transporter periplasmic adaptor subunit [Microcystis aeruginosa WS75]NCR21361.1 efflux RND transporter periplasmic adaptor subunit [Microcystis aeruginosa L111-01]NCR89134.1 efflux RND transporter periplasmic adaptor subunit [Microcystis aeruginosa G13-10]NCS02309.1 efflux RND transporter periplasmic adaptor subunit [Microcystis aeruginosa G13-11]NCS14698.1 efflux RND transporter periplasmic adaptor subunit [Microcystis aeruginosa G13-12]NCS34524.1 efflux RND transporter periplas